MEATEERPAREGTVQLYKAVIPVNTPTGLGDGIWASLTFPEDTVPLHILLHLAHSGYLYLPLAHLLLY